MNIEAVLMDFRKIQYVSKYFHRRYIVFSRILHLLDTSPVDDITVNYCTQKYLNGELKKKKNILFPSLYRNVK